MSLPLCNTVEIFVFSIMTDLKVALFNTVGTCSEVVYLLNCYGTLMVQPSNRVSWEPRKEELFVFLSLADEALFMPAQGQEWLMWACLQGLYNLRGKRCVPVWDERFEPGTVLTALYPFLPLPVILRDSYCYLRFISEKTVAERDWRHPSLIPSERQCGTLSPGVCFISV